MDSNQFLIELQAKLDEAKSITNLNGSNGDIAKLQQKLEALKLQVKLDPNAAQNLANEIGKLINQKITISNINVDTGQVVRNAQQTGQQIGDALNQGVSQGLKNNAGILDTFRRSLENIGMGSKEIDAVANRINNLGVQIESLNQSTSKGKTGTISVNISGLDQFGQAIKLTQQYNTSTGDLIKNIDAVSTVQQKAGYSIKSFEKQQSQAVSNLTNQINQLNRAANDQNASRPITDVSHLNTLSTAYSNIISSIEKMKNASSDTFITEQNNVKTLISDYKSLVSEFRNAENIATQMKSVDISSGIAQAQERLGKLKADSTGFGQMAQTLKELDTAIANVGDKSSLDAFIDKLRVAESQLSRVKAETKSIAQVNKIQFSLETGGYESKVESLISRTKQWTDESGNARINTDALKTALDNLGKASTALSNNNTVANQKALIAAEKDLDAQIKTVTNSVRSMNAELAKDSVVASLHNQVADFMSKNGKAVKSYSDFYRIFNETAQGAKLTTEQVRILNQEFNNAVVTARNAGKLGKTFFQTLRDGMSSFSYWTSSTFLVMKAIQSVKSGISTVKDLDTALVDLKKTTKANNAEIEKFYYNANNIAKQLGATTQEVIQATADWSRLGYTLKEAQSLAETSTILRSISPGMSMSDATETIVSTIKAYGIEAEDALDGVASKINIIGKLIAEVI